MNFLRVFEKDENAIFFVFKNVVAKGKIFDIEFAFGTIFFENTANVLRV